MKGVQIWVKKWKHGKPQRTKEELAKLWKDYYDLVNSIYPVESFEIPDKNGEPLSFHHGTVYKNETDIISYFLRDSAYQKAYQEQKKKHLLGEETPEENIKKVSNQKLLSV